MLISFNKRSVAKATAIARPLNLALARRCVRAFVARTGAPGTRSVSRQRRQQSSREMYVAEAGAHGRCGHYLGRWQRHLTSTVRGSGRSRCELNHIRLQQEAPRIPSGRCQESRRQILFRLALHFVGARLARHDIATRFDGERAAC